MYIGLWGCSQTLLCQKSWYCPLTNSVCCNWVSNCTARCICSASHEFISVSLCWFKSYRFVLPQIEPKRLAWQPSLLWNVKCVEFKIHARAKKVVKLSVKFQAAARIWLIAVLMCYFQKDSKSSWWFLVFAQSVLRGLKKKKKKQVLFWTMQLAQIR